MENQERKISVDIKELNHDEKRAEARKKLGLGIFKKEMERAPLCEILEFEPQAIAVLSGGIVERRLFPKAGIDGNLNYPLQEVKLTSTSYKEKDAHGEITGSKARYLAIEDLWSMIPNQPYLISTSGQKTAESIPRTHAEVGAQLIKGLSSTGFAQENQQKSFKIPEEKIILEENSFDTISNLIEIIALALRHGWQKIGILSNRYHGPRVKAFWSCLQDSQLFDEFLKYKKNKYEERIEGIGLQLSGNINEMEPREAFFAFASQIKMIFIAAEDILEKEEKEKQTRKKFTFKARLLKVYESEEYKQRIILEETGYKDFLEGNYGKAQWLKLHQSV